MFGRGSTPLFEPKECGPYGRAIGRIGVGSILIARHDFETQQSRPPPDTRQTPNRAPPSPKLRRRRQSCAAVAKVAPPSPKLPPPSPKLRRHRQSCAAVAKVAPPSPKLRRQRQMRRSNRQCCALNPNGAQQS